MADKKNHKKMKKKKTIKNYIGKALCAFSVLVIILLILICAPLSVPTLFGYQIYHVISGSMEPAIPEDSVVYTKKTDPASLEVGDVIVFYTADSVEIVTTHRVMENDKTAQELATKGDANAGNDMHMLPYEEVVGKVTLHIPWLGHAAEFLDEKKGKMYALCVVLVALIVRVVGGMLDQ